MDFLVTRYSVKVRADPYTYTHKIVASCYIETSASYHTQQTIVEWEKLNIEH